ncbi:ABC transporter permease [Marinobacter sp. F3R11]|uniref:ABC transporter permease n=1 Tax=Marinobacter sp. F3R11 TaxID=2267231 RepID=UPI000DE94473|nr:ABC transporter permease [Marinobacter sp. F3R11]RBW48968.1 ABC transporter permease [Marinobacter sp. F3R11]
MKARLAISLATASLWHRRKVLALVCLTLTLSVTLLLGIQYLRTEVKQSFTSTISDTDLIIGARSGQINLLLYTVFHIGDATNNIRWSTFQELKQDTRIDWLIPISLGDSYKGFRVVGTDESFGKHFRFGRGQPLTLASGQWFDGVFDVVLGAGVAKKLNHALDDKIILSHGGGSTSFSNHTNTPFTVTGILEPTGTPVDQAVYISLQGMEAIHVGWESGVAIPGRTLTPEQAEGRNFTPSAITAVFAGLDRKILTFRVQRDLNQYTGEPLSAILPGVALSELWRLMSQFERALLGITGFVVITSLIGLIAVLLTLQTQRAHEIAILRATGASPGLIASLYIIECLALAVVACVISLALSTFVVSMLGPWLLTNYGLQVQLRPLNIEEWALLASVPLAAVVVALIPAFSAWQQSRSQGFGSPGES